jgi:hypothetical protein
MPEILNMRGRRGVVPPGAVYIGRDSRRAGLAGSKWANPFTAARDGDVDEVIAKFRVYLLGNPELLGGVARAARHGSGVLVRAGAVPRRGVARIGQCLRA